jgi:hypothetical protein
MTNEGSRYAPSSKLKSIEILHSTFDIRHLSAGGGFVNLQSSFQGLAGLEAYKTSDGDVLADFGDQFI